MRRRRLLAGLSGLAGVGGLVGSGAFTSVSADRSVEVDVADDADALLALSPCGGPNGQYVTTAGGTVAIDLTGGNGNIAGGGDGVNAEALTVADDVLRIENQGTQDVGVWLSGIDAKQNGGQDRVQFYLDGDPSTEIVGQANAVCLGVGDALCVGLSVDTTDLAPGDPVLDSDTLVVNADAEVSCTTTGGAANLIPGPTNGLAHYWPLDSVDDGTAEDVIGGSDGVVSGAVSTAGQVNGSPAALFDGVDDVVTASGAYASSPITVSAWFRVDGPGGKNPRVVGTDDTSFRLYVENDYKDNDDSLSFDIDGGPWTDSPGTVADGQWHHGVGTYDGSTARLYLDGSSVDSATGSVSPAATGIFIGEKGNGLDAFNGAIDDVRIYDRALSDQEVTDLYDATK